MVLKEIDDDRDAGKSHPSQTRSGILSTGQSLAVGFDARLPHPTLPVPNALKLHDELNKYNISDAPAPTLSLVPLQEPFRPHGDNNYPKNIEGKTPHSAFVSQFLFLLDSSHHCASLGLADEDVSALRSRYSKTAHTAVGKGGAPMSEICKNGTSNSYAASLFEARACNRLLSQRDERLVFDVILLTHGETDAINPNREYGEQIIQMQQDYATDLAAITGQENEPVLILSQQNTVPPWCDAISEQVDVMWRVQARSGGKVVCAGPKYQYGYARGGLHLDAPGYDRLGEKYAEVFWRWLVGKLLRTDDGFYPLSPRSVEAAGKQRIVVEFQVPSPPLTWDEFLPTPHHTKHQAWVRGRGFEVRDAAGQEVTIQEVEILEDGESVAVVLAEEQNSGLMLSYAMTQDAHGFPNGFVGGTGEGKMGHLCDSNDLESASTEVLGCRLEDGSREVLLCDGTWKERDRALWDLIEPGGNAIVEIDEADGRRATLGHEWAGSSGVHNLKVSHSLRNYCVAFIARVGEDVVI